MGNWCIEIVSVRCNWWVWTKSDHSKLLVPVWSASRWRGEGLWLPAVAGAGMLTPGVRLVWAPLENVGCCGGGNRAKRCFYTSPKTISSLRSLFRNICFGEMMDDLHGKKQIYTSTLSVKSPDYSTSLLKTIWNKSGKIIANNNNNNNN